MDPVAQFLVLLAGLFLLGTVGEVIFARTQIPDVVWLIVAGIVLGPVTGVVPRASLVAITPYFAALTLIIVLFEGGSRLVLDDLLRAAPRASLLAVLSFVATTLVVAVVSVVFGAVGVLPSWSFSKGVMLGAILGGSSSLIVMPSMSLAKVKERVANLVNLESALTDALCVVVTFAMVDVVVSGAASLEQTVLVLLRSFGIAFGLGLLAGWAYLPILRILAGNPHVYPLTLSALILLYVIVDQAGGSAALGILTFAVIVGNAGAILRRLGFDPKDRPVELDSHARAAHSQISFIVKSFFFTFIGLMLSPPWGLLALGGLLGLVMLGARIPAVYLATRGVACSRGELELVSVSFPRGMAAGVLATIPSYAGVRDVEELPTVVFAAVITTIALFAGLFPRARRRIDEEEAAAGAAEGSSVQARAPAAMEGAGAGGASGQGEAAGAAAGESGAFGRGPDAEPASSAAVEAGVFQPADEASPGFGGSTEAAVPLEPRAPAPQAPTNAPVARAPDGPGAGDPPGGAPPAPPVAGTKEGPVAEGAGEGV